MKNNHLRGGLRYFVLSALAIITTLASLNANAIPVFARQTGFKCIACHVGGEYPQLTSLGRMFKLTGYTMGDAKDIYNLTTNIDRPPVAVMIQTAKQFYANNSQNQYGTPANTTATPNTPAVGPSSNYDLQVISLFAGGHITDNVGAFVQWTGNKYDGNMNPQTKGVWSYGIDNTEFRYADRFVSNDHDLVYGVYLNNRWAMQDVWNTLESAWTAGWINYFNANGPQAPQTVFNAGASQHQSLGVGTYVFLDKTWYAELGLYKSIFNGPLSLLTADVNGTPLIDPSPYVRLAYNKEWGPHNFELGLHGMNIRQHNSSAFGTPTNPAGTSDTIASVNNYRDVGIDSQYQYILDPHYFAAHFRYTHESASINGDQLVTLVPGGAAAAANPTNTLNEIYADVTYMYNLGKYGQVGSMLFYQGATGSSDSGVYPAGPNGSPDWSSWTPSVFWAPWQNVRLGAMYTYYTKIGGCSSSGCLNGPTGNLGPHDWNTGMLFATIIY